MAEPVYTAETEKLVRERWAREEKADAAQRFENLVQRLAPMATNGERAAFLKLVEDRHDADLQKQGPLALRRGLAHRLRVAAAERMRVLSKTAA